MSLDGPLQKRSMGRCSWTHLILAALCFVFVQPGSARAQSTCRISGGFAALSERVGPSVVGQCVENERALPSGDVEQRTTRGLFKWSKSRNWISFTGAQYTWIAGPASPANGGLWLRPITRRFQWEPDAVPRLLSAPSSLVLGPAGWERLPAGSDAVGSEYGPVDGGYRIGVIKEGWQSPVTIASARDDFQLDAVGTMAADLGVGAAGLFVGNARGAPLYLTVRLDLQEFVVSEWNSQQGTWTNLAYGPLPAPVLPGEPFSLSVQVVAGQATCSINGAVLTSTPANTVANGQWGITAGGVPGETRPVEVVWSYIALTELREPVAALLAIPTMTVPPVATATPPARPQAAYSGAGVSP